MKKALFVMCLLLVFGCVKRHEMIDNKMELEYNTIFNLKHGNEIIYNGISDTILLGRYKFGKKVESFAEYWIDERLNSIVVKRLTNKEDSFLLEDYINGKIRFRTHILEEERKLQLGYYNNGDMRFKGYFFDDYMVSMVEYDTMLNIINFSSNYTFYSNGDSLLVVDFQTVNNSAENKDLMYAFYEVKPNGDTSKITAEWYLEKKVVGGISIIELPNFNTGRYYVRIGCPFIQNYKEAISMCNLDFTITKKGELKCNTEGCGSDFEMKY